MWLGQLLWFLTPHPHLSVSPFPGSCGPLPWLGKLQDVPECIPAEKVLSAHSTVVSLKARRTSSEEGEVNDACGGITNHGIAQNPIHDSLCSRSDDCEHCLAILITRSHLIEFSFLEIVTGDYIQDCHTSTHRHRNYDSVHCTSRCTSFCGECPNRPLLCILSGVPSCSVSLSCRDGLACGPRSLFLFLPF